MVLPRWGRYEFNEVHLPNTWINEKKKKLPYPSVFSYHKLIISLYDKQINDI